MSPFSRYGHFLEKIKRREASEILNLIKGFVQSYKIREREKASAREKSGRPAVLDTSGMGEAEREQATQEMNDARMDERDEAGRRVHNFLRQVEAKMVTHDLWKAAAWGGGCVSLGCAAPHTRVSAPQSRSCARPPIQDRAVGL